MIADAFSVIAPGSSSSGTTSTNRESSGEGAAFASLVSIEKATAQAATPETLLTSSASPLNAEDVTVPLTGENVLLADLTRTDGATEENLLLVRASEKNTAASADALSVGTISANGRRTTAIPAQLGGTVSTLPTAETLGHKSGLTTIAPASVSPPPATQIATATTEQAAALASTSGAITTSTTSQEGETGRNIVRDAAGLLLKTEDGAVRTETTKGLLPARALTSTFSANARVLPQDGLTTLTGTVTTDGTTALFGEARGLSSEGSLFLQRVQATATTAAPVRPEAFQQIADTIRLQTSDQKLMLRLDPPELGRVGIELSFDNARLVTAVLTAENADTASLLRRSIENLHRELSSAGFEGVNIDFAEEQSPDAQAELDMWSEERQLVNMSPADHLIAARGQMNIISADRIDARF